MAAVRGIDSRLGFVFQQDAVFPWLTVERNIEYGPRAHGIPRAEREAIVARWAEAVGLTAFRKAYPKQLSGGMRKRVDLARAYANSPDVLLMDEPFAALDVQTKQAMQESVLDLWQSTGKTVVFVTHDLDEAAFLAYTAWVHDEFARRGTPLLATYWCPHHPEFGVGDYRVDCGCRKPAPGMLLAAIERFAIDPAASLLVGDSPTDLDAARAAGVRARLLRQEDWGRGLATMLDAAQ